MLDEEHRLLDELITRSFGLTFPSNRREILRLRLEPRLRELKLRRFMDYYLTLQCDGGSTRKELCQLVSRITNNETYFFREVEPIRSFYRGALRELNVAAGNGSELRILCAGCSSGEEAYTLGMIAREERCCLAGLPVEIHAFDVDGCRLTMAQHAVYGKGSLRALDAGRLATCFEPVNGGLHRLRPEHRQGVYFFEGNIVRPDSYCRALPYDAIFCRNVLIYFSEEAVRRAVESFARVLRPGGLLFLGHSESIIGLHPAFEAVRVERSIAYRFSPGRR